MQHKLLAKRLALSHLINTFFSENGRVTFTTTAAGIIGACQGKALECNTMNITPNIHPSIHFHLSAAKVTTLEGAPDCLEARLSANKHKSVAIKMRFQFAESPRWQKFPLTS